MAYREQRKQASSPDNMTSPHSIDAERSVLGAILKDPEAISIVFEVLDSPDHFYSPKHQIIFSAILKLNEKSEPCDVTTVTNELQISSELVAIGGRVYLVQLLEDVATIANLKYHCDIVLEKSLLRKLINTSTEIVKSCYASELPIDELLNNAEANIFSISQSRLRKGFVPIKELMPNTFTDIENLQSEDSSLVGLKTGFNEIDVMTNGLHSSDLIIVAGRPSMGKSSLVMNMAEHVAVKHGKGVGVFSIEMSKESLVLRMLCGRARISQQKLRSGKLSDKEWEQLSPAGGILAESPIYIDDSPMISPLEMRAKARRLQAKEKNLGLIIVDYIQMMHSTGKYENRQQEMSSISRSMKILAKELEVPVIVCSQLSRNVESRPDKRPMLSDLRESGAIEQDADLVMFVYRAEHYMAHVEKTDPKFQQVEGKAEIIIAKQRNGPTGVAHLAFVKEYARFENLAPGYREVPHGVDPVDDTPSPF